jgi:hypothetical protein
MSAVYGGIGSQSQSKIAGAAAFWTGVLTVEAAVGLALAAIFAGVAQVENQIATCPARDAVSCDQGFTSPAQPDSGLREIVRPQP